MEKDYKSKRNFEKMKMEIDEAIMDNSVYQLRKQLEEIHANIYGNGK